MTNKDLKILLDFLVNLPEKTEKEIQTKKRSIITFLEAQYRESMISNPENFSIDDKIITTFDNLFLHFLKKSDTKKEVDYYPLGWTGIPVKKIFFDLFNEMGKDTQSFWDKMIPKLF